MRLFFFIFLSIGAGLSQLYCQKQLIENEGVILNNSLRVYSKDSVQNASSSIVEIQSKDQGFAFPLFTSEQRQNIVNPEVGLIIYDTDENKLYFFDGTLWQGLEITNSKDTFSFELYDKSQSGFGEELILQEDFAFIAAPDETEGGHSLSGVVYYFKKNSDSYWVQKQVIKPPLPLTKNFFGYSMSFRNDTLVCMSNNGVYIFAKNSLTDTFSETHKIDVPFYDYQPIKVKLWQDYLAIVYNTSSYPASEPHVYIYKKRDNSWDILQIISDSLIPWFGYAIDINDNFLFLGNGGGAYRENPTSKRERINVYKLKNGQFELTQIIEEDGFDRLGTAVKYHNNALYASIRNGLNIYSLVDNSWHKSDFVSVIDDFSDGHFDIYGDFLLVSQNHRSVDDFTNSGKVVIMKKSDNGWVQSSIRTAPDIEYYTWFGKKVSVFKQDYIISGYSAKKNKYYVLFGRTDE